MTCPTYYQAHAVAIVDVLGPKERNGKELCCLHKIHVCWFIRAFHDIIEQDETHTVDDVSVAKAHPRKLWRASLHKEPRVHWLASESFWSGSLSLSKNATLSTSQVILHVVPRSGHLMRQMLTQTACHTMFENTICTCSQNLCLWTPENQFCFNFLQLSHFWP